MDGGENMHKDIWIIANWKSNKTIPEALEWIKQVGPGLLKEDNLKIAVCPVFNTFSEVKKAIKAGSFPLLLGSQDLSPFEEGAYTGEEPAQLLTGLVDLAILGHSERRKYFAETDEMIAKKVQQALDNNIIPLVCVQDENTPVFAGCKLVAYEPVWAIGSGNPDTPENANKVAGLLKEKYGQDLMVLYGGSINPENAKEFIEQQNINGLLIGKSSLDAQGFSKICQIAGGEILRG